MANGTKFTPKKKEEFLHALTTSHCNVSKAAKVTGVTRQLVYKYRDPQHELWDPDFAQQWDEIKEAVGDDLEEEGVRRAMHLSDTMLIFMLKAFKPDKYRETLRQEITGADGGALVIHIERKKD